MDPKQLEAFFFEAMRNGYAAGAKPVEIPRMWHKGMWFKDKAAGLYLIDAYCVNKKTNYSAGTTTIFHDDVPVWWMGYWGWYQKSASPMLKEALLSAYRTSLFYGGRGAAEYKTKEFVYKNFADSSQFHDFAGHESVWAKGIMLGQHHYRGGLMRPLG